MALLNGMTSNTQGFLVLLGQIAGGLNAFALCAMALGLLLVTYRMLTNKEQYEIVKKHESYETFKRWAPCLIPLSFIMILTSLKFISMLASNKEFSGAIGLLAFAKAILL